MALTDLQQLEAIAPSTSTDAEQQAALDALDSDVNQAALYLWRKFRSALISNPLAYQVQGDYSADHKANVAAVEHQIELLEALTGDVAAKIDPGAPVAAFSPFKRSDRDRL